jgi:TP901 family phage tail tape measure protein
MPIKVPVTQTGLEQSIQNAATKAGKNLKINMGPGAKSVEGLTRPLGRLTGKADEFTKSMEAANARVLAFGASVGVIAAVSNALKQLVTTSIEVEKSLTNINSILKQSESQLDGFKNQIFDIARNTGQTFDTVAEAALELSRQGLKAEEVTKRLNDALVLSRLSGLSAAESVAGLTAAVNSFSSAGLTTSDVLNKISAAAASAAVSDRDLIEGLKRSGAVAVTAGVKFDELIGIISALQERTARGGSVIGNSLKTIFTRIQDIEKLNSLQDLGIQVTDLGGQVLSSSKIIENLAPVFAKLDQASKVNLADNLVGKFQIAPFLALLEDYNQEVSRSGQVAATSFNATNEAYKRNEVLSQTLATAINTTTVSLKELANALGEIGVTENLSKIIGVFNSVVSSITGILDGDGIGSKFAKGLIKGISAIISGPGLALALLAIGKLLLDFAKFGTGALRTFFGLNKAAEAQKNLQGQIAASLLNDKGIRSAILSIEKQNISAAEKKILQTQFFTKALNEQLMVMQKMQGIAMTIAPGVMKGTASRRGGRAAGGFLPVGAEKSDISRGVGGAPASAKPVVIPNFAFGGGKRGTMVANSSEYIVPNYANGGDAIFNQNMASSMGLPANARKVRAASGYIPNFASVSDLLRRPGNFIKPDGSFTSNSARDAYNKSTGADRAKLDAHRNRNKGKRSYMANQQPNKSIMLVPQPMEFGMNLSDHKFVNPHRSAKNGLIDFFEGPAAGISKKLKKGTSAGNKFKKLLTLDEDIENAIAKGVNTVFGDFKDASGNPNIFKTEPNQITASNVKKTMEKGGPGALGAIKGATFEALMQAIVGGVSQKGGELDVDFSRDKKDILDLIFGIEGKNFKFGDFKNNIGLKDKFARQVVDNVKGKVITGKKSKTVNSKTAASGYIPNFAEGALEEAVGREKAAGLPVSQIRINQSGKLRNAQNPMGLAVTNTRDEPTGAIPAARGFIPNFVGGVPSMGGLMDKKFEKAADSAEKSAKALDKNTNNLNKNAKSSDGLTGKLIAVQMGMSLFNSGLGEATKETDGFKGSLAALGQGAIAATQVLFMMQALGMSPGFKLGGSKRSMATTALNVRGAMTFGAKGGALNKATKGLGGMIGKLAGGFGRFIPILGTAITAFMVLNPLIKKLTGDGIIGHIGKALGLIDTPAEKASKALDELADSTIKNLKSGSTPFRDFQLAAEKQLLKAHGDKAITGDETKQELLLKQASKGFLREDMNILEGEGRQQKIFEKVLKTVHGRNLTKEQREKYGFESILDTKRVPMDTHVETTLTGSRPHDVFGVDDKLIEEQAEKIRKTLIGSVLASFDPEEFEKVFESENPNLIRKAAEEKFKTFSKEAQEKILNSTVDIVGSVFQKEDGQAVAQSKELIQSNAGKRIFDAFQEERASAKAKKESDQEALNSGKAADLINLANAKARLNAIIELRKFQLLNNSDKKKELETAKILGTFTEKELRDEELKAQLQDIRTKQANERLTLVGQEINKIEGIKNNLDAIITIEEKLANASVDKVNNTDEFKKLIKETLIGLGKTDTEAGNIADRLLAGAKTTDKLKKAIIDSAEGLGTASNNALDLVGALKEAAGAASRIKILDEGDVKLAAQSKQEQFQARENNLNNQINKARNRGDVDSIEDLEKQLKQLDIERFSNPAIKALRNQERENTARSAGNEILSSGGEMSKFVRDALTQVAEGKVNFTNLKDAESTRLDIELAFRKSLKDDGLEDKVIDDIMKPENISGLSEQLGLVKQINEARNNSLETSKQEQLMQEKSLQQSRDLLNIDTRSVEIRLIRLNNGIKESRQAAMAQKKFEAQQFKAMGLDKKSALSKEDFKTIKDNSNLTPANALEKARLESSFGDRMKLQTKDDKVINSEFLDNMVSASVQFRDNFAAAFAEGIKSVDDLEDALLNVANQFLQSMTKSFTQKFMDQAASEGGGKGLFGLGILGLADGGKVRGGSGNRDDVPAMLMGGEYVMNKKAVQRYGSGFMEALNSGSVRGFSKGGEAMTNFFREKNEPRLIKKRKRNSNPSGAQVRDEEGMFTTPGMRGAGAIVGMRDLMSFATQSPLAMNRDTITSHGAFLDAESARFSVFGRRNNPQFQKVQDAKRQALGLVASEAEAHKQAKEQEVSLGKMLLSAAISTVVSYGTSKFLGGLEGADGKPLLGKGMTGLLSSGAGNLAGTLSTGAPASGGAVGAAAASGDLMNLFSDKPKANPNQTVIKDAIPVSAPSAANPSSKQGFFSGIGSKITDFGSKMFESFRNFEGGQQGPILGPFDRDGNYLEALADMTQPQIEKARGYATGGLIPAAGGVDTVPAMLSGGEFVMNAAATKNIGAGNLQALNSGAGTGDNTDLVSKLDELIAATETSQSTGDINITINGSNGTESQTGGEDAQERERKLSERIKVAVKQVIADEQRLGGQLRK